jgi:two-component sensor histidine kinase
MANGDTVLVVDDNPSNLSVISDFLAKSGFRVLFARDGESAIAKALHGMPDIILLDIMLPGIDGFEACRRLKAEERLKDIPVVFTTALSDTKDKVDGFSAGGIDYITKPFRYEEVLARVSTHLEIRKARRSLAERNEMLSLEIEERKKAEAELRAIRDELERRVDARTAELRRSNRLLKTLGACNKAIVRSSSETELLGGMCRLLVETGGYRSAWIGYPEEGGEGRILPVAWFGESRGASEPPEWGGPAASEALRTRARAVSPPAGSPPPGGGECGCACIPLGGEGSLPGVLAVSTGGPFPEEDLDTLEDLAGDIAFGIRALRTRESLVSSLREKTSLLSEVHHRVKNNLQIITSILRLQADSAGDGETAEMLKGCENRVMAMAMVHECLYASPDLESVDFKEYVRDLVGGIFLGDPRWAGVNFSFSLERARMSADEAISCGLILVELVTNALKHAFPPGWEPGARRIEVATREDPGGRMVLSVSDSGMGLCPEFDPKRAGSLGMRLLTALVTQLRGELAFRNGPGASFEIRFPQKGGSSTAGGRDGE